jgi:superfamily II DNA/RNA helicase
MNQNARNRTIMNMRRGKVRLLVATDVAARGLDVSGITHVINYDLPKNAEDYVHRIGRTGRAGATGIAISFASGREMDSLSQIERYIGQSIPQHVIVGLEPARPLRRSSGPGSRPSFSPGKRPQGATAGRRFTHSAAPRDSFGSRPNRKAFTDTRFNRDEKKNVNRDRGEFSNARAARPGRPSRWA